MTKKQKLRSLAKVLNIPYEDTDRCFFDMVKIIECYQQVVGASSARLEEYGDHYRRDFISRLSVQDR